MGDLAFFAGGMVSVSTQTVSNRVDIYNAATNQWTIATLSVARSNMAATTLGDLAFFAGGRLLSGKSNAVDVYNATAQTWSTSGPLSQARSDLAAVSVGQRALFAGGNGNSSSAAVDIFEPPSPLNWSCPTGWLKADAIGANAARCYRRFHFGGENGAQQDQYRSGDYSDSCTSNGSRLATFSSYSEFATIGLACNDTSDMATYFQPGCWLDGITASPTTSREAWDWATPNIPETNQYLVGTDRNEFWGTNEPTGYWWANQALPETCMQILINGQLNDYPCEGGLAAVCMKNATLA